MPPPAFENDYRKGEVKTVKDCWTCRKNTVICLSEESETNSELMDILTTDAAVTANYASGGDFFYMSA